MSYNNQKIQTLMERILAEKENENDESIVDALFDHYCECSHQECSEVLKVQNDLHEILLECVPDQADQLMNMVHIICFQFEREGFRGGLKTGFRLTSELQK